MPYCDWARQLGLNDMRMLWWSMQRVSSGARGRPASVVQHKRRFDKFSLQVQLRSPHKWNQCAAAWQRCSPSEAVPPNETFQFEFCDDFMCFALMPSGNQTMDFSISTALDPAASSDFEWHCTCSFVLHASRDCKTIHWKHIVPSVFDLLLHNRLNFWRISFYSEI